MSVRYTILSIESFVLGVFKHSSSNRRTGLTGQRTYLQVSSSRKFDLNMRCQHISFPPTPTCNRFELPVHLTGTIISTIKKNVILSLVRNQ